MASYSRSLNPRFQPTIRVSLSPSQVLGGHLESLKLLKLQHNVVSTEKAGVGGSTPSRPPFQRTWTSPFLQPNLLALTIENDYYDHNSRFSGGGQLARRHGQWQRRRLNSAD